MPELTTLIDQIPPIINWLAAVAVGLRLVLSLAWSFRCALLACAAVLQSCSCVVLQWRQFKALIQAHEGGVEVETMSPLRSPRPPKPRNRR